jgi:5-methyltetrahydrofolate--homocysteine methyltransferase
LQTFIAAYTGTSAADKTVATADLPPEEAVRQAVLKGNVDGIATLALQAVNAEIPAGKLVDDVLIPAITEVGDRFERKEYFLPQLIRSADAMRTAMDALQPCLAESRGTAPSFGKIILATVKGDIHDIGKNIVAMMLRNCGFEVIDLGKDVPAEVILDAAVREDCRIVGLSALMTTTMGEMKNVIELARQRGLNQLRFMVGGAVVDAEYAASIGADYSNDALDAVKTARRIREEMN